MCASAAGANARTAGTVGTLQAQLGGNVGARLPNRLDEMGGGRGAILRVHQVEYVSAPQGVWAVPPAAFQRRALVSNDAVAVQDRDDVGCVPDERAEALLAASKPTLLALENRGATPLALSAPEQKAHGESCQGNCQR